MEEILAMQVGLNVDQQVRKKRNKYCTLSLKENNLHDFMIIIISFNGTIGKEFLNKI